MKKEEINISKSIFEGHLGGSEEKINQQLNMDATKIPSLGYAKKSIFLQVSNNRKLGPSGCFFFSLSLSLSFSLFVAPSQRSLKVDNFHIEWHQVEKSGIKINGRGNHKTVKIKFVAIFPTRKLVRS